MSTWNQAAAGEEAFASNGGPILWNASKCTVVRRKREMAVQIQRCWRSHKWNLCRATLLESLSCCVCQEIRSDIMVCHRAHATCATCILKSEELTVRGSRCSICGDAKGFCPSPALQMAKALRLMARCGWCERAVPVCQKNEHESFCPEALYECPCDRHCEAMRQDALFEHVRLHNKHYAIEIDAPTQTLSLVVCWKLDLLVRVQGVVVRLVVQQQHDSARIGYVISAGTYGAQSVTACVENYEVDGCKCVLWERLETRVPQLSAPDGAPSVLGLFMSRTTREDRDDETDEVVLRDSFERALRGTHAAPPELRSLRPQSPRAHMLPSSAGRFKLSERVTALSAQVAFRVSPRVGL